MSLLLELDHLEIDDSSDSDDETTSSDSSYDSDDEPNYAIIRFEVDNVSTLDKHGRSSPEVDVGGLPWKVHVSRRIVDGCEYLASYLFVQHNKSRLWSITITGSLMLFNSDHSKDVENKLRVTYKYGSNSWGYGCFLAWKDLMDEEKGFIKDNSIAVKAEFYAHSFEGYRSINQVSFTNRYQFIHDMALVIDGKKVYVSKQILSIHSPVFNAMFYGNFDENDKKKIELKDVDRQDFVQMLNLIYHSYYKITDDNAEFILGVADRFQMQSVIDQVEQFLISSSRLNVPSRLKLSNTYRLARLQGRCIHWFERNKAGMNQEDIDSFIAENIGILETTTQFDFTDANEPRHNIAIVFDKGETIYASKRYLYLHLKKLYDHDAMRTEDAKEIKIANIDREEFLEMLRVIYPTGQKITDANVKFLATLGDYFKIKYLLDRIETHLISSSNLELGAKLLLSDRYKLIKLQAYCFNSPQNMDEMERIMKSAEYKDLSDATKVALLEEVLRFPR